MMINISNNTTHSTHNSTTTMLLYKPLLLLTEYKHRNFAVDRPMCVGLSGYDYTKYVQLPLALG